MPDQIMRVHYVSGRRENPIRVIRDSNEESNIEIVEAIRQLDTAIRIAFDLEMEDIE